MKPLRTIKDGRKVVKVYHDNFEYYQPNTHVCGDCAIRCVAGALKIDWEEALRLLIEKAFILHEPPTATECIGAVLEDKGFVWKAVDVKTGGSRPKVHEFSKSHKGTYVFRVSNHVVCARNGYYKDIWDCGEKCLYGYWEKK